jgi:hypothetical protein
MDLLLIGVLIAALFLVSTVSYLVGVDKTERLYHRDMATARLATRRVQRDLEEARVETAMLRRIIRDKEMS